MDLNKLGWNPRLETAFEEYKDKYETGRVSVVHRNLCRVFTTHGEIDAVVSRKLINDLTDTTGKTRYQLSKVSKFPAVGDWVLITYSKKDGKAILNGVLPRGTKISRSDVGRSTDEQIVAANIDRVFLVMALNFDFNLRRVERYLTVLANSGIAPVVVLNKSDLVENLDEKKVEINSITSDVPVHITSAMKNEGLDALRPYLTEGSTNIFIGSSGAGKTTMINKFIGEDLYRVQDISEHKDRGKHTTSAREMIVLKNGSIIIDTPGLRRIDLWNDQDGLDDVFSDIVDLSNQCKFRNCTHTSEPHCAIIIAIGQGKLSGNRLANYKKLQGELAQVNRKSKYRQDRRARIGYKKGIRKEDKVDYHQRDK
ncbi:MAG: ribosome small subunit-dependent GTPase A [Candidatus Marinimicrobia bacterium]|jgi:ribosome biogenesis GTPase|nr:ribosome small subunit-dependent GTPase A [Candidatus Neomarinimicrobiota bacterium]MBT3635000.1 ribosome small subunit-dependent GTPase A [Candidatus Neomarinimicrobiota bacterium]MBT3683831.1 ribosome small subunit-dependent GTPase A [Candidatus Neomarinimicrobiota bacterium]MBT3760652.1 ribosome small subunit-dependent GTPase A [Candidatus Neomarinimicrobiota bacterium]MBT3896841.1 ribosome small subunit-dependent GTPase A [Candidatus Neomarinimicrobiota bacterium]